MAFKLEQSPRRIFDKPRTEDIELLLKRDIKLFGERFNSKKKQAFYKELAVLLKAGITIKDALSIIIESTNKKSDKILISQILSDIINGITLSKALAVSGTFSDYEIFSMKIGEETGTTDKVCMQLSIFFERKNEQRRIIISALTYPCIVLSTAILVVVFMLNYVVPMFQDIFKQNNMELPTLTRMIMAASQTTKSYGIYMFLFIVAVLVFNYLLRKNYTYKQTLHRIIIKIPLFGPFMRKVYLSQLMQGIALLTASKVPLLNSIQMVGKMIVFIPMQEALSKVERNILLGKSLSVSMKECPIFDNRIISLIKVAEETNQNEYVFSQLSQQYNDEIMQQSKLLTTLLEPLIILFVGLIVGILLIAMYLPMFQLSSAIG